MNKIIILTLLLSASAITYSKTNTKKVMNKALISIVQLVPFFDSDMKFSDPKSAKIISKNIKVIQDSFKSASHIREMKKPGFAPSYKLIKEHFDNISTNFKNQSMSYSRLQLKSTVSLCMSCHVQIPESKKSTLTLHTKLITRKDFNSHREYGEFLYLTRKYNQAINWFEKSIKERLKKQEELNKMFKGYEGSWSYVDQNLLASYRRILGIYLKIKTSPNKALSFLKKQKKAVKDGYVKSMIQNWIDDVQPWAKKKVSRKSFQKGSQIKDLIKTVSESNDSIAIYSDTDMLIVGGAIGRYLNNHPKSEMVPELLLWMGKSSLHLNKSMFFELGDHYLLSCIKNYSSSKYAKECFDVYKDNIEFGFTGSGGTFIPKDKIQELIELKKLLK